jgi:hypothetical protein
MLTITNMAMVQNFAVAPKKFNVMKICSNKYTQVLINLHLFIGGSSLIIENEGSEGKQMSLLLPRTTIFSTSMNISAVSPKN